MSDDVSDWQLGPVTELRAVIPVAAEYPAAGGGRVIVTSVELWAHAVRVHVNQVPPPNPASGSPMYELGDDLGTRYRQMGGGGELNLQLSTAGPTFTPPVPDGVRVLRLHAGGLRPGDQVEIELPS